jgi:hypothetical protein
MSRGRVTNREEAKAKAMNCPAPSPGRASVPTEAMAPIKYRYMIIIPISPVNREARVTRALVKAGAAEGRWGW